MANAPNVTVVCPRCGDGVDTDGVSYSYDPGCYRTSNGDGWPPSEEFEVEGWEVCSCGFNPNADATDAERDQMEQAALEALVESGTDEGPEYEPDDER